MVLADYQRLWDTGFLNDLWVEVIDTPYDNGVPAKTVIFNMEERERGEGSSPTRAPRC